MYTRVVDTSSSDFPFLLIVFCNHILWNAVNTNKWTDTKLNIHTHRAPETVDLDVQKLANKDWLHVEHFLLWMQVNIICNSRYITND